MAIEFYFLAIFLNSKCQQTLVGLFLLICDIAINPTKGFPFDIENFESFIVDVDVGIRFCRLTFALKEKIYLSHRLKDYSKEEYLYLCYELCEHTGYDHPAEALQKILSWKSSTEKFDTLMKEHECFDFNQSNQPIRVMFSHFVEFCEDKLNRPEYFCWPAKYLMGTNANDDIKELWLKHLSLFGDHAYKKGVYPRLRGDRSKENVQKTFNDFYGGTALYDLTRQWILKDGEFKVNYNWLSHDFNENDIYEWANKTFQSVYGIDLQEFKEDNNSDI